MYTYRMSYFRQSGSIEKDQQYQWCGPIYEDWINIEFFPLMH